MCRMRNSEPRTTEPTTLTVSYSTTVDVGQGFIFEPMISVKRNQWKSQKVAFLMQSAEQSPPTPELKAL